MKKTCFKIMTPTNKKERDLEIRKTFMLASTTMPK